MSDPAGGEPKSDLSRFGERVTKALSLIPTIAAVVEGWLAKAIPMADDLRPRAAFLSTLLAVFGLMWVWRRPGLPSLRTAWIWVGVGVVSFLSYLTLWDLFPGPPNSVVADQALRHALLLTYTGTFFAFSIGFAFLLKSASS